MLSVNFYIYLQLFMCNFLYDQKLKMKDVAASSANDWVYDIGSYRLKAPELNLTKIVCGRLVIFANIALLSKESI